MKRFLSFITCIMLVFILASCQSDSFTTPNKNVDYLCKNLSKGNFYEILNCFSDQDTINERVFHSFDSINFFNDIIFDYISQNTKQITYKILEQSDPNTISVEFTYIDGSAVLDKTLNLYLDDVITKLHNNETVTQEQNIALFETYFNQVNAETEDTFITETITFNLVDENGNYLINNYDEKLYDVITSNLLSSYNQFEESLN